MEKEFLAHETKVNTYQNIRNLHKDCTGPNSHTVVRSIPSLLQGASRLNKIKTIGTENDFGTCVVLKDERTKILITDFGFIS